MEDKAQRTQTEQGPNGQARSQAVLDALADAETLRSVTWPSLLGLDGTPSPYEPYAVIPHGEESYWRARYAARAAFRAVPELRG